MSTLQHDVAPGFEREPVSSVSIQQVRRSSLPTSLLATASVFSPSQSRSSPPEPPAPTSLLSIMACLPELEAPTQLLKHPAAEFSNILNWKTSHERATTTEPACSTTEASTMRLKSSSRRSLNTPHWEGPLTSLSIQQKESPNRPGTVSLDRASSFLKDSRMRRELTAIGSRSQAIETAIRNNITGATGVADFHPQGPCSRTSHELHMVIIVGSENIAAAPIDAERCQVTGSST